MKNIKVAIQSVRLNGKKERDVIKKMRLSQGEMPYEYIIEQNDYIVRFTSEQEGVLLPLLHFEAIEQQLIEQNDKFYKEKKSFALVYLIGEETCQLIKVADGAVRSSKVYLRESFPLAAVKKDRLLFVDKELLDDFKVCEPKVFPEIDEHDLAETEHYLGEKEHASLWSGKNLKIAGAAVLSLLLIGYLMLPNEAPKQVEIKAEEKPKIVRNIQVDEYYAYKRTLVGKATYEDLVKPMMAAALMAYKLPSGWTIEDINVTERGVEAPIHNYGGKTQAMKYFRENSGYSSFITVEGSYSNFLVQITPVAWFEWTKKISKSYEETRDEVMDLAITLGAKVEAPREKKTDYFTSQQMELTFDRMPISYLDTLRTYLDGKPVFIDSATITPLSPNYTGDGSTNLIKTTINLTIIGQ